MFADLHTLHALHHIRQALTDDMSKTVAASPIHTRIDYEDSVTYTSTLYKKKIRMCTKLSCLRSLPNLELQWLPVTPRIACKLACLTYKLLTTGQPAYLYIL